MKSIFILLLILVPLCFAFNYNTDRMNFPPGESREHIQTLTNNENQNITLNITIPDNFNISAPCNVTNSSIICNLTKHSTLQYTLTSPDNCTEGTIYKSKITGDKTGEFTYVCIPDNKIVDCKTEYGHGDANYLDEQYISNETTTIFNLLRVYNIGHYLTPDQPATNARIECKYENYPIRTYGRAEINHYNNYINGTFSWNEIENGYWFRIGVVSQEISNKNIGDNYNIQCSNLTYNFNHHKVQAKPPECDLEIRNKEPFSFYVTPYNDEKSILSITNSEKYSTHDLTFDRLLDGTYSTESYQTLNSGETISYLIDNKELCNSKIFFIPSWYINSYSPRYYSQKIDCSNLNYPPQIDNISKLLAYENHNFYFKINATDDQPLNITSNSPIFNISNEGIINFTPQHKDIGTHNITIYACDTFLLCTNQTIEFTVREDSILYSNLGTFTEFPQYSPGIPVQINGSAFSYNGKGILTIKNETNQTYHGPINISFNENGSFGNIWTNPTTTPYGNYTIYVTDLNNSIFNKYQNIEILPPYNWSGIIYNPNMTAEPSTVLIEGVGYNLTINTTENYSISIPYGVKLHVIIIPINTSYGISEIHYHFTTSPGPQGNILGIDNTPENHSSFMNFAELIAYNPDLSSYSAVKITLRHPPAQPDWGIVVCKDWNFTKRICNDDNNWSIATNATINGNTSTIWLAQGDPGLGIGPLPVTLTCGDNSCSYQETQNNCPQDCGSPTTGGGSSGSSGGSGGGSTYIPPKNETKEPTIINKYKNMSIKIINNSEINVDKDLIIFAQIKNTGDLLLEDITINSINPEMFSQENYKLGNLEINESKIIELKLKNKVCENIIIFDKINTTLIANEKDISRNTSTITKINIPKLTINSIQNQGTLDSCIIYNNLNDIAKNKTEFEINIIKENSTINVDYLGPYSIPENRLLLVKRNSVIDYKPDKYKIHLDIYEEGKLFSSNYNINKIEKEINILKEDIKKQSSKEHYILRLGEKGKTTEFSIYNYISNLNLAIILIFLIMLITITYKKIRGE